MKKLTVFTPTYNRAYILPQVYNSLLRQTNTAFIWLIIDDGSSDNTQELVQQWQAEDKLEIQYIYQENQGMHGAHNTAYENISTELNVCIDSDDFMTDDAVEKILLFWKKNGRADCGGIYALDVDKKGMIIGEKFPDDLKEFKGWGCKIIYYNNGKSYSVKGDKKFISVTKVLKEYPPIPMFKGEKYYSLYFKQHLIEQDYTILIMNEPVCVVEYLEDGSSMNIFKQYINNPKGFQHLRLLMVKLTPSPKIKIMQLIHYINASIILRDKDFLRKSPNKLLTIILLPFGVVLYGITKYMNNKLLKINKK